MPKAFEYSFPLEVKLAANTGEITGYGSTFGGVDSYSDTVAPGAFAATLAEHKAADTMPALLWAHDPSEPIGVWLEAREDDKGLLLRGKLTTETKRGAEARALAKAGALALSIGFVVRDADYEGVRRVLKDVKLYEVSLVAIPANPQAKLISVKSANAADEIRSPVAFERFLKAHGFANSLARKLAAGWDAAVGRKDADDAGAIAEAIKSSAKKFKSSDETKPTYWSGVSYWRD